jgi:hypothetical protein
MDPEVKVALISFVAGPVLVGITKEVLIPWIKKKCEVDEPFARACRAEHTGSTDDTNDTRYLSIQVQGFCFQISGEIQDQNVINDIVDHMDQLVPPIENRDDPRFKKTCSEKLGIPEPEPEPEPEPIPGLVPELVPVLVPETKPFEWIQRKRGDPLPKKSVYAGTTKRDGPVYVGRFKNTPGKINLDKKNIHNFWVEWEGSSQIGEVLIINGGYKWETIKSGQRIPDNAIESDGRDHSGNRVWVGRSMYEEPGKINCHNDDSENPEMCNLWCHSSGKDTYGEILTYSI